MNASAWRLAWAAGLALALAGCSRCGASGGSGASGASDAAAAADAQSAAVVKKKPKGGTDVTFLVVSDTHFGFGGIPAAHEVLVPKLNGIAGRAYPKTLGGVVAAPRGLLVTGDLTEWGKVDEWEPFAATYGLTGKEGKLAMPVFEVVGNHDKVSAHYVEEQVAKRHGGGRFYAWDWDDVHFLALGEAPDDEGLAFLKRELDGLAPEMPLVLYFHLALSGPWSTENWFAEGTYKERLAALLEKRNVAAIFHGHHHATDSYRWHGIDVFKPGAVKDGAHTFAVVHVTDERMSVAEYDWDRDRWEGGVFEKLMKIAK